MAVKTKARKGRKTATVADSLRGIRYHDAAAAAASVAYAAYASVAVSYAADARAAYASAVAYTDARTNAMAEMAGIVRKHYPEPPQW